MNKLGEAKYCAKSGRVGLCVEGVGRFNKIPLQGATHESSVRGGTRESATRFSLGGEGGGGGGGGSFQPFVF